MKTKILLLFFLLPMSVFCQSDELVFLKGKVVCAIKEINAISVYNHRSESATTTNENGSYTMFVKVGDTLEFKSVQVEAKKIVIEKEDLTKKILVTTLTPKVIALDEVEIKQYKEINAVSLGILEKPAKKYTPAERKLKTASDFDATASAGLMAGGSIGLDPILNAISGRTTMLKKEVGVERKERLMLKVENQFGPDYFTETLKIPKEYVKGFWFYIVEDAKFTTAMNAKNKTMAKFLLAELATKYLDIIKTEKE